MKTLRWVLAFFIATVSWLYFPYLCDLALGPIPDHWGEDRIPFMLAVLLSLNPIVAIGVFAFILPSGKRRILEYGIIAFSVICFIGTLLVGFAFLLGEGPKSAATLVGCELTGTVIGAIWP